MRVGVIGPTDPDSFADNILHCLPELGAEAISLGPATPMPKHTGARRAIEFIGRQSAETQEYLQRGVVRRAREARCDVVINLHQALMPTTVGAIKATGARIGLWYPDAVSNISRMAMFAAEYDGLFLKDPLLAERLTAVYGYPATYLPEACNPHWHRPIGDAGTEPYIVAVGNLYPTRARLLRRLDAAGIPLRLYGAGFPRWYDAGELRRLSTSSYVTRLVKSQVFREARGVLNNLHPAEMESVNARLFEATAAGGAVLCEDRPVLHQLFDVGSEVLAFSSFDQLVYHCRALLSGEASVTAIGDRASARSHAEHNYGSRLRVLLDVLG